MNETALLVMFVGLAGAVAAVALGRRLPRASGVLGIVACLLGLGAAGLLLADVAGLLGSGEEVVGHFDAKGLATEKLVLVALSLLVGVLGGRSAWLHLRPAKEA